jgi:hypothetical protein
VSLKKRFTLQKAVCDNLQMAETPKSPDDVVKNPFASKASAASPDEDSYLFQRFEKPEFTGTAWSYFKIYFINILLTLLTLGFISQGRG